MVRFTYRLRFLKNTGGGGTRTRGGPRTGGGGDWLFELWWNWFLSNPIEVVTVKIG